MLWIGLFIVGVFGVLAGVIPLILNGARAGSIVTLAFGLALLVSGTVGVVARPDLVALRLPRIVLGGGDEPAPTPVAVVKTTDSLPAPDEPAKAEPAAPAASSDAPKDESQMAPAKLPEPVTVTTTKVVGVEPEPMANQSAQLPDAGNAEISAAPAAPAAPAQPNDAEALAALVPQQPRDEAAFTKVVTAARQEYEGANFDDRAALQSGRAAAICGAVKGPAVQNWVGRIKEIDKDAGGRTIVTVSLPDGTLVKTWNNAMSDIEDKTLIVAGTPLATAFAKLAQGDAIRFSGTFFNDEPDCFRSSRLSLDQSMTEPSFLFRFNDVEKL
ncbi:hypothetical protein GGR25_000946 [Kaistia hirudinis]|uniref:Uncharacterized protein n=1 Tax=Kaistia hirudinis TaxID=1293440 RepID=A0A840ALL9_9HYPH|nr:hypothetical protein [Kaistia hirudinis]MBB3929927.1 hypothetical protein [Kaistia hirudinis]